MSDDVKIMDEAIKRDYYAMIPNLVDELGLSVYAFRLYCHLKKVTGETGECWQSTRTLAQACNMSVHGVSNAK